MVGKTNLKVPINTSTSNYNKIYQGNKKKKMYETMQVNKGKAGAEPNKNRCHQTSVSAKSVKKPVMTRATPRSVIHDSKKLLTSQIYPN